MAEVIGYLREDATHGEKETLKWLRSLPKEYTIYIEPPIRKKREIRYPDFVILTNYGYVVLEVKDWVSIVRATPHEAVIRTRNGQERSEPNPVTLTREYALALHQLICEGLREEGLPNIPYSYAVVLINQPASVISRLRRTWGNDFVLGRDDLKNADVLLNRLKNLFPAERLRPLTRAEIDRVRRAINPVVEFETPDHGIVLLDHEQERLVTEPPREPEAPPTPVETAVQAALFASAVAAEDLPPEGHRLSQSFAIRLVRGFSGSGKTLVLIQRARYLRAAHPEWTMAVLTYNKPLQERLQAELRGLNIDVHTFHSLCFRLCGYPAEDTLQSYFLDDWLKAQSAEGGVVTGLTSALVKNEINWLRDMGITQLEDYLKIERHGIGTAQRLNQDQRRRLFALYEDYRRFLREKGWLDYEELALQVLEQLEHGQLPDAPRFDAILVDEAQDWAPVWIRVITHLLKPEGMLFLTDDPSQSIYRYFSWKEKGIHVVGRTRWLRVPYRNTWEIYQAAYQIIADAPEIQQQLLEQGEPVLPEISKSQMRHGPRPLLRRFATLAAEVDFLREQIEVLRREGLRDEQIAVLVRNRSDVQTFSEALRGFGGLVDTLHRLKGLEMEAVFIPSVQKTFAKGEDDPDERRLIYMGMTRARSKLFLSCSGRLPRIYEQLIRTGWLEAF
ncbi:UvrD-helicase domain-containing protein [uncultured Thermanaerothrix sp.]|uniref:nuclease-related domain-containing DEAD/DEAH box helicase n=1 Tax=uncultured Thermanaerothrix sp. TaxID=1195149 RepID=UPI00261FFD28|nr:UvrD-helicase domain-containing protein [uncultured Thermanaerothrix sp.]